jgi:hypothetical protein
MEGAENRDFGTNIRDLIRHIEFEWKKATDIKNSEMIRMNRKVDWNILYTSKIHVLKSPKRRDRRERR